MDIALQPPMDVDESATQPTRGDSRRSRAGVSPLWGATFQQQQTQQTPSSNIYQNYYRSNAADALQELEETLQTDGYATPNRAYLNQARLSESQAASRRPIFSNYISRYQQQPLRSYYYDLSQQRPRAGPLAEYDTAQHGTQAQPEQRHYEQHQHLHAHDTFNSAPVMHKVFRLACSTCGVFFTNRGMKAVLLLRPDIHLYSTDALPSGCSAPPASSMPKPSEPVQRTCDCLTQTLCCHGCGNQCGYAIVTPCLKCSSSGTASNNGANGHRFVFHDSEIVASERLYFLGEPDVVRDHPPYVRSILEDYASMGPSVPVLRGTLGTLDLIAQYDAGLREDEEDEDDGICSGADHQLGLEEDDSGQYDSEHQRNGALRDGPLSDATFRLQQSAQILHPSARLLSSSRSHQTHNSLFQLPPASISTSNVIRQPTISAITASSSSTLSLRGLVASDSLGTRTRATTSSSTSDPPGMSFLDMTSPSNSDISVSMPDLIVIPGGQEFNNGGVIGETTIADAGPLTPTAAPPTPARSPGLPSSLSFPEAPAALAFASTPSRISGSVDFSRPHIATSSAHLVNGGPIDATAPHRRSRAATVEMVREVIGVRVVDLEQIHRMRLELASSALLIPGQRTVRDGDTAVGGATVVAARAQTDGEDRSDVVGDPAVTNSDPQTPRRSRLTEQNVTPNRPMPSSLTLSLFTTPPRPSTMYSPAAMEVLRALETSPEVEQRLFTAEELNRRQRTQLRRPLSRDRFSSLDQSTQDDHTQMTPPLSTSAISPDRDRIRIHNPRRQSDFPASVTHAMDPTEHHPESRRHRRDERLQHGDVVWWHNLKRAGDISGVSEERFGSRHGEVTKATPGSVQVPWAGWCLKRRELDAKRVERMWRSARALR